MDLSKPGEIIIAQVKDTTDLLIVAGNRQRSVRCPVAGIAILLGRAQVRKRDVLMIAPELLLKPALACGRFEMCEEMHDADREDVADRSLCQCSGARSANPKCPIHGTYGTSNYEARDWSAGNDEGEGRE